MEYYLIFSLWNLAFVIPSWIPFHSPVFLSVKIITKKLLMGNNPLKDSHEVIYDENVLVLNVGLDKRVCNIIYVIMSYE